MRAHRLKSWPSQFAAVRRGDKTHETRKDDRDYQEGDFLLLEEFDPKVDARTGDSILVRCTFINDNNSPPHLTGAVVMSVRLATDEERELFNGDGTITWLEQKV